MFDDSEETENLNMSFESSLTDKNAAQTGQKMMTTSVVIVTVLDVLSIWSESCLSLSSF